MENALIVCDSEKYISYFSLLLNSNNINNITIKNTAKEAREVLNDFQYDLVIINSPLKDELGKNLSIEIKEKTVSEVIYTVQEQDFLDTKQELKKNNIHTISKPFNRRLFVLTLETLSSSIVTIKKLNTENEKLTKKLEEIKKIDRAKCLLISYLGMSEKQAHKYIEKQAMDFRQSKLEIATKILKTYEG